ncbi:hypothetical protein [uncultured Clostridium sp.]|uniref:hypothetical protein n=1 Tax=uncultured Clostridium sp. TaxID=59620 RepID=UPI0032168F93
MAMLSLTIFVGCENKDNSFKEGEYIPVFTISKDIDESIKVIERDLNELMKNNGYDGKIEVSKDKAVLYLNDLSKLTNEELEKSTRYIYDCYMDNGLSKDNDSFKTITIEIHGSDKDEIITSTWTPGSEPIDSWIEK